jgi:hypothetical protein
MERVQTEEKDYARDLSNQALINTNRIALEEHKKKRKDSVRLDTLERDVKDIMSMMVDMHQAIRELGARK